MAGGYHMIENNKETLKKLMEWKPKETDLRMGLRTSGVENRKEVLQYRTDWPKMLEGSNTAGEETENRLSLFVRFAR